MREITIFLASSLALDKERDKFDLFFKRKNESLRRRGFSLVIKRCEHFLDSISDKGLQQEYNQAIRDSDVFVMLVHNKVGKYTSEEFERALDNFSITQKPRIFVYFKDFISRGSIEDQRSLLHFRDRLKEIKHYETDYSGIDSLNNNFGERLEMLIVEDQFVNSLSVEHSPISNQSNFNKQNAYPNQERPLVSAEMREDLSSSFLRMREDEAYEALWPAIDSLDEMLRYRVGIGADIQAMQDIVSCIVIMAGNTSKGISIEKTLEAMRRGEFKNSYYRFNDYDQAIEAVEGILIQKKIYAHTIEIPVIVYAMTEEELRELNEEGSSITPIVGYEDCRERLEKTLIQWKNNYQKTSTMWIPLGSQADKSDSIRKIIERTAERIKSDYSEMLRGVTVKVSFQDIHTIADNREVLKRMRKESCVLIIDSVSLYHPVLFKKLKEAMLEVSQNTFISLIYPSTTLKTVIESVEFSYHLSFSDLEIYKISSDLNDEVRFRHIYNDTDFAKWFSSRMKFHFLPVGESSKSQGEINVSSFFKADLRRGSR